MSEQPGAAHEATLALPFEGEGRLRKAQRTLAGRVRSLAAAVAWRGVFLFMDVKLRLNRPFRRLIYRPAVAGGLAADSSIADDWRARIVVEGRDGSFAVHAIIGGGRVRQGGGRLDSPDLVLSFRDADTARAMLTRRLRLRLRCWPPPPAAPSCQWARSLPSPCGWATPPTCT